MTDFFEDPERWLNPYARMDKSSGSQTRKGRFRDAMMATPKPDLETAPRHVIAAYYRIYAMVQVHGWKDLARELPRQRDWWYRIAVDRLAKSYVLDHLAACTACEAVDWAFLLSTPERTPRGVEFDLDGNIKTPPKNSRDRTDTTSTSTEESS